MEGIGQEPSVPHWGEGRSLLRNRRAACSSRGHTQSHAQSVRAVAGPTEEFRMVPCKGMRDGGTSGRALGWGAGVLGSLDQALPMSANNKSNSCHSFTNPWTAAPRLPSGPGAAGPTGGLFSEARLCFMAQEGGCKAGVSSPQKETDKS